MTSGAARRGGLVVAAVMVVLGLGAGPAAADEPGESDEARVLVQQAIALIANTPGDDASIEERIDDALAAPKQEGVDLDLVEQAMAALGAGSMEGARSLLERAIGAGPFVGDGVPAPIRETRGEPGAPVFAVGGESGTTVVLDEFDLGGRLDGGDWLLLLLSSGAAAGGLVLARRWRPPESIRTLRRMPKQREAT